MTVIQALPSAHSQQLFGVYLRSLSEPGALGQLPSYDGPALATAPLVLVDLLAPVAAVGDDAHELVADIAAATGAKHVELEDARVAVAAAETRPAQMARLHTATNYDPQTACVLVQRVAELSNDLQSAGIVLELAGPGIESTAALVVNGVGQEFVEKRNELCADFPRGIDIFFVTDAGVVAGLPRSTTVTVKGNH